jgi:predicted transcriptional regulator
MSKRVRIGVGSIDDMGQRFIGAWHRLESGEKVRERHLTFPDLPALLRDVHRRPAPSVQALATRLGRDYKRVHEDVERLTASGLLRRTDGQVSAPYDAITAEMRL